MYPFEWSYDYPVVVTNGEIDVERTEAARRELRSAAREVPYKLDISAQIERLIHDDVRPLT